MTVSRNASKLSLLGGLLLLLLAFQNCGYPGGFKSMQNTSSSSADSIPVPVPVPVPAPSGVSALERVWSTNAGRWDDTYFSNRTQYLPTTGNLLPAQVSNNSNQWYFSGTSGAYFDSVLGGFCFTNGSDYIQSNAPAYFAVADKKTYTITGEILSNSFPGIPLGVEPQARTAQDRFAYNLMASYPNYVSQANQWQKFSTLFYVDKGLAKSQYGVADVSNILLYIYPERGMKTDATGALKFPKTCIRNLNVYNSEVFAEPPNRRTPVDTYTTRVDELGNVSVLNKGVYTPLFIRGAYGNGASAAEFTSYANQGWNTYMWAQDCGAANNAATAGLYVFMDLTGFLDTGDSRYGNMAALDQYVNMINSCAQTDKIIGYYIDNEVHIISESYMVRQVINYVKSDLKNGKQRRPVYMLNGSGKQARISSSADFTGAYLLDSNEFEGTFFESKRGFTILQQTAQVSPPTSIAQINISSATELPSQGVKYLMMPTIYRAIIEGAKGFATWRNGGSIYGGTYANQPWFPIFVANAAKEIDKMMSLNIIQYPNWTSWTAQSSNADIHVGTREVEGRHYLIVANMALNSSRSAPVSSTAAIKISGLAYATAVNIFDGATVSLENLTVPAARGVVYELK